MDSNFLNRKEVPTNKQILNLFFSKTEINELFELLEFSMEDFKPKTLAELGDPDEIDSISGTEWVVTKVKWKTEEGPRYLIFMKRASANFTDVDFTNINTEYFMNSTFNNQHFNYNNIEDIDHEDAEPLTFQEQLDLAIEYEEFEEAARLRDWNQGLLDLMKDLKPKFIEAIENADLKALDRYQKIINDYRKKL